MCVCVCRYVSVCVFVCVCVFLCVGTTCLRSGWRGVLESGKKLLSMLDKLAIWPVAKTSAGKLQKRSPGNVGMSHRLKRLWEFIRLQLHQHMEDQSSIAAHCTRMHLGSLGEPRFNRPCTHKHPKPTHPPPKPVVIHDQQKTYALHGTTKIRMLVGGLLGTNERVTLSSTCTKYRSDWTQEWPESLWQAGTHPPTCGIKHDVCDAAECKTKATYHCRHCDASFCRPHCAKAVCTDAAENLSKTFGADFVCTSCSPQIESCQHSVEGCATCAEMYYFKQVSIGR